MVKVEHNSTSAFLIPGLKDIYSSTLSSQSEPRNAPNKEKYTVEELAEKLNKNFAESGTHIKVKLHEKTNTIMVSVVSDETNEVVLEIPREKLLDMMYNMCVQVGVFLDEKI